jgi:tetratricopeptide (TPR) repeat protein
MLASASDDRTVKLWDVDRRTELATLRGHTYPVYAVAWSPDGRLLASGSVDQTIKIWDVNTRRETATLRGHGNRVHTVSWSPDGRRLASGSTDQSVKLWEASTGREIATLRGHTKAVAGVGWSPNGRLLASASTDQTVRLWDASIGYCVERSPTLLPDLDETLIAHPRSVPDLHNRARIRAALGRWDEAAADWNQASQLEGNEQSSWFQAGWWVLGPLAAGSQTLVAAEASTDPMQPVLIATPEDPSTDPVSWRAATATANGCLDLAAIFPERRAGFAYALLRVYSPHAQPVAALLDSTHARGLWVNGQLLDKKTQVPTDGQDDAVLPPLQAGWNTLLFKVDLGTPTDRLCLWLSAEPGDYIRALVNDGRWGEAEALLLNLLQQQSKEPRNLLLAGRFFRRRAENLRQLGQNAEAERAEGQARVHYEKLLAMRPDHEGYAAELGDLLLARPAEHWEVLSPSEVVAAHGTTLTKQLDGSILASGKTPLPETYTITAETRIPSIMAIRLEVLTDPSLPGGGPGRGPGSGGNFTLNELRVTAAPPDDAKNAKPIVLHNAWADHSQGGFPVAAAIDNNLATGWAVAPETGWAHVAVFEAKEPLTSGKATNLTFTLEQQHKDGDSVFNLGRFRLSVTSQPQAVAAEKLRALYAGPNRRVWTKLAAGYYLRGEWQTALAILQKTTAAPSGGSGWDHQLLLTLVHEQLGQHYEPGSAGGWIDRARAYLELAQSGKALADSARAVELQPRDVAIRRARMDILVELKQWHAALADCLKAVELEPHDPELLTRRANLSAWCGKYADAAAALAKLTQMADADPRHPWMPWYRHALALLAAGRTAEYRKACARMLEHFKDAPDVETAFFTAWTAVLGPGAVSDFAPALRLAENVAAADAQNAHSHQAVGAILYRMGRLAECLKHLDAAAVLADREATISSAYVDCFRAMAHHRLGHGEEARKCQQRAAAQTDRELRDLAQTGDLERWVRKATLQLLRAEAEAVLREPAAPGKQ